MQKSYISANAFDVEAEAPGISKKKRRVPPGWQVAGLRRKGTCAPGWSWAPQDQATSAACRNPTVCVEALTGVSHAHCPGGLGGALLSQGRVLMPCGQRAGRTFRGRGGARTPRWPGPGSQVNLCSCPHDDLPERGGHRGTEEFRNSSKSGRPPAEPPFLTAMLLLAPR